jgi:ribosomal protein S18 acetylase RimI-like enzyme
MILKPVQGSIFIKWLHPSLVTDAACLECYSCENFWNSRDFLLNLRNEKVGGYLATDIATPIGFLVYENNEGDEEINIINFVMRPEYRRQGIATMMIEKVKGVAKALSCQRVIAIVRESNITSHLFLKANGFVCEQVMKCYFEDEYEDETEREDGYKFLFRRE